MPKKSYLVVCHTDGEETGKPFIIEEDELLYEQEKADEASGGEWHVKTITGFDLDVTV